MDNKKCIFKVCLFFIALVVVFSMPSGVYAAMSETDTVTLKQTDSCGRAVTDDGTYIYSVVESSPTRVIKVQMSDMNEIDALTLNTGENNGFGITNDGTHLYIVTNTAPTRVIKVKMDDMERVGAVTLGHNNGSAVTHDGTYLYVVTNTSPTTVTKVQMSDLSVPGLNGTRTFPVGNNSGRAVTHDGTHLYVVNYTIPTTVTKVQMSDLEIPDGNGTLTLNAGEDQGLAVTHDNSHLYVVNYSQSDLSSTVTKVQMSDMSRIGATTLTEVIHAHAVTRDDTYLYVATLTSPIKVAKVNMSDMQLVGSAYTVEVEGANFSGVVSVTSDNTHLYMLTYSSSYPINMIKLDKSDMTKNGILTLAGENNGSAVTNDGTFLYVVNNTSPTIVTKVRKSDKVRVGSLTLNTGENNGSAVTHDGTYLYVVNKTSPTIVTKVKKDDMTRVNAVTLAQNSGSAITRDGDYLYVVNYTTPTTVTKVQVSDLTVSGTLTLNMGENSGSAVANDGTYLYVVNNTSPTMVTKVQMSDLTRVNTVTLAQSNGSAITKDGVYLYVVNNTSPTTVAKVQMSDLTVSGALTLTGENNGSAVTNDGTYLYVINNTSPTRVTRVRKSDMARMDVLTLSSGVNKGSAVARDSTFLYVVNETEPTKVSFISYDVVPMVTGIAVKTQPTKLAYNVGEALDLSGLVATLTYDDSTSEDVALANFAAKGITASPANGTAMTVATHNGHAVTLSCNGQQANTNNLTVAWSEITAASVTVTAPIPGTVPQNAAAVETATSNADYTVTSITWNEALVNGKFKAGQAYTATIVLTSKNNKRFQAGAFTPTVAGSASVTETTTAGAEEGNTVTFTVTYAATGAKTVTGITVKTQPTDLTYTQGENLDLTGLEATLTYNDTSTEDVALANFTEKGITASPANGTAMTVATHNGHAVTLSCNGQQANTNNLTVNAAPTYEISLSETGTYEFTAITAGYDPITPVTVTVTKTGTGNITNLDTSLSGANQSDFAMGALDVTTLDSITTSATFTIKPNDALAPGTYSAAIMVTADNGVSGGFNISFTVNALSTPTLQSAVAGDAHVNITWSSISEATGYKIYKSTTSNSYTAPEATVTGSVYSYDATGLTNGTTYYFAVKAVNPGGDSAYSNEVSATPQVASPGVPVVESAVAGDAHVNITWSSISEATGYKIYKSTTSNSYTAPEATVAGSVYSYDATGLTNGTTYYFAVKAVNPGGDSAYSNEVSATPKTVPGVPTEVSAAAGNGQVVVSFTAPNDNGGSSINGYFVTSSPGGIIAEGTTTPITVTGLTNGTTYTFTVKAKNEVGEGSESAASNAVTPSAPSSGGSPGGRSSSSETPSQQETPSESDVEILVNGKSETAATSSTTTVGDETVTTVTVDDEKVEEKLQSEGNKAVVTIPVANKSDVVVGELTGQTVKNMAAKEAILEIKTVTAAYTLPAAQINIDSVSEQIGTEVELKDIRVNVKIAVPSQETTKIIEDMADNNNYLIVVKPVDFEITCSSGGKSVNVSKFNGYVERTVAIPDGIDPGKITTGVVLNDDGTFSHVPTTIISVDGKYFAKINSLSNSTYSVIWSPKAFADVENHWAREAVNDMGSRLIINGTGDGRFEPGKDITRAEFATIVVKALGLMKPGTGKDAFMDVTKTAWYYDAVSIACEYGIISGYGNGEFRPMDKVTREQAMAIIARAMKITGLKVNLNEDEIQNLLAKFGDSEQAANWARESMADCIKTSMVSGTNNNRIAPKDNITRAEVAVVIRRLLQKSNLI